MFDLNTLNKCLIIWMNSLLFTGFRNLWKNFEINERMVLWNLCILVKIMTLFTKQTLHLFEGKLVLFLLTVCRPGFFKNLTSQPELQQMSTSQLHPWGFSLLCLWKGLFQEGSLIHPQWHAQVGKSMDLWWC